VPRQGHAAERGPEINGYPISTRNEVVAYGLSPVGGSSERGRRKAGDWILRWPVGGRSGVEFEFERALALRLEDMALHGAFHCR